jgi:putative hemolysin
MTTQILFLLLLIFLNGIFAMSEMAVATSRKARLQPLAEFGDAGAAAALDLHENPTRFLSTVQIGITTTAVLIGIVGEGALAEPFGHWLLSKSTFLTEREAAGVALVVVVFVITFLSIVLGELVPKRIAQIYPEQIARFVSRPMRITSTAATPLVRVLSFCTDALLKMLGVKEEHAPQVTEEEIQVLMEQGTDAGIFEEAEQQMVRNVFRLDERKIGSLMVPRGNVVYLDIDDPIAVNTEKIAQSDVSRFPVCQGSLANVLGIARAKDLLAQAVAGKALDLTSSLQPVLYVPETLSGVELVENFRKSHTPAALVVDEYGDVQGMVTLRDILEAIVGEFPTPLPEESSALQRDDGSWLLDGVIALPELQDTLDMGALPEGDSDTFHTLAGMLMLLMGRIPRTGDKAQWGDWQFEVVDMDGKRIDKVLATRLPTDSAAGVAPTA